MSQLLTAAGLVLVLEGLFYALAPRGIRRMMTLTQSMSDEQLRLGGLIAIAAGVAVVWTAKAMLGPS
jgi:uncharacterized protein YjeT (DUF2065 family)